VFLLRLLGLLALIAIGVCLALYAWKREAGYLRMAWRILLAAVAFGLALMAFYAFERLMFVV
jgi:hypothetical protein